MAHLQRLFSRSASKVCLYSCQRRRVWMVSTSTSSVMSSSCSCLFVASLSLPSRYLAGDQSQPSHSKGRCDVCWVMCYGIRGILYKTKGAFDEGSDSKKVPHRRGSAVLMGKQPCGITAKQVLCSQTRQKAEFCTIPG